MPPGWRWGALLVGLSLGAAPLGCSCGEDEEERERPPATSQPHVLPEGTHETREADPRRPPAELGVIEGSVTIDGATAVTRAPVEPGQIVGLGGAGRATLELPGSARATLWTEGAMLLAEAPDRGLWIVSGVVHVTDPPSGLGARTPMRVATPTATIELQGAGDVVVTVEPTGATVADVLNGEIEVTSADVDARHRLRTQGAVAGQSIRIVDRAEEAVAGSGRLDEALSNARAALLAPPPPTPGAPVPASLHATMSRLDEAMRWLESEERRGRDLTARHRSAVQAGRSDEAMQYQREIVGHAQTVHALRQLVLTRWERFGLTARASGDGHGAPELQTATEEVAPRLDRLRNLLGS